MSAYEWRISYLSDKIVVEVASLSTEILNYTNGEKHYIFETPSRDKLDHGVINIFIYDDEFYVEWLDDKELIKSISVPGKTRLLCADNRLQMSVCPK